MTEHENDECKERSCLVGNIISIVFLCLLFSSCTAACVADKYFEYKREELKSQCGVGP